MSTPVYLITGFLDAGKTTYIQSALEDPDFAGKERTLVLLCEEGDEEFDLAKITNPNVTFVNVENESDLTTEFLKKCQSDARAKRVIIEYNGMWQLTSLYEAMPKQWEVYQNIMLADSSTFSMYFANMRQMAVDKLEDPEVVIFNRYTDNIDKKQLHRDVGLVNRFANIVYEHRDGTVEMDDVQMELPFDINAPVIDIDDRDYGLWYIDATENPAKYVGKTVRFLGYVCQTPHLPKGCMAVGRFAMICCEADISYFGVACECKNSESYPHRSWVRVEAKVESREHEIYAGNEGPWLKAISVTPAEPPKEELVSFNN